MGKEHRFPPTVFLFENLLLAGCNVDRGKTPFNFRPEHWFTAFQGWKGCNLPHGMLMTWDMRTSTRVDGWILFSTFNFFACGILVRLSDLWYVNYIYVCVFTYICRNTIAWNSTCECRSKTYTVHIAIKATYIHMWTVYYILLLYYIASTYRYKNE